MLNTQQQAAVPVMAKAAVSSEIATGLPASLTMAQCIIESGWLKYDSGNNSFGIKAYPGCPATQLLPTTEWLTLGEVVHFLAKGQGRTASLRQPAQISGNRSLYDVHDLFAAYPTLDDCFVYHAKLITEGTPYAKPWAQFRIDGDVNALILGIAPVYATAPNYAATILELAHSSTVVVAVKSARTIAQGSAI